MVELSRHDRRQASSAPDREQAAAAGRVRIESPCDGSADGLVRQQRLLGALLAAAILMLALSAALERRVGVDVAARSNHTAPDYRPRIAVNDCEWSALCLIPGISTTLAQRIVADRRARGPFTGPSDLRRVAGIGPAKQDQLSAWLDFSCDAHDGARRAKIELK